MVVPRSNRHNVLFSLTQSVKAIVSVDAGAKAMRYGDVHQFNFFETHREKVNWWRGKLVKLKNDTKHNDEEKAIPGGTVGVVVDIEQLIHYGTALTVYWSSGTKTWLVSTHDVWVME